MGTCWAACTTGFSLLRLARRRSPSKAALQTVNGSARVAASPVRCPGNHHYRARAAGSAEGVTRERPPPPPGNQPPPPALWTFRGCQAWRVGLTTVSNGGDPPPRHPCEAETPREVGRASAVRCYLESGSRDRRPQSPRPGQHSGLPGCGSWGLSSPAPCHCASGRTRSCQGVSCQAEQGLRVPPGPPVPRHTQLGPDHPCVWGRCAPTSYLLPHLCSKPPPPGSPPSCELKQHTGCSLSVSLVTGLRTG